MSAFLKPDTPGEAAGARAQAASLTAAEVRPTARGKFLYLGKDKLYVRGVTYGPFRPNADEEPYPEPEVVERDFKEMTSHGINAVRTYTRPPAWLLDLARLYGLRLMIGLPGEQPVTFLDDARLMRTTRQRVREAVRDCAGHPAVLCYVIGNEIPASIVRWHGRGRTEGFLRELYEIAKQEDPEGLVTYVNYPTTEYLDLSFLDLLAFNVYLESREKLHPYLQRLHNLADERPLLMAEVGLDSLRHGEQKQAEVLDWQIRTAFETGCAGLFVFGWTGEWFHGGYDIEDWDFGLTTRERQPKPALGAVARAFADAPVARVADWPRISVVVCSYNGESTIRDTLDGLDRLDYPNYEGIVVNDGSTDRTSEIASEYDVRLISTPNRGLACARNTGLEAARGEIVAYIDDDAFPDPQWLTYLALTFSRSRFCGVGGPNLMPPEDGEVAECVANAPGGPAHVLLSDQVAEHIPGCNMAFRREWLERVGGFDPQFRAAGDDVDICWNLQRHGGVLGFHHAALVWHHRRSSISRYWKQQLGYGKAEALLERKWPEKYNTAGHVPWSGRIYARGVTRGLASWGGRIYQGTWGSAPFQSIYRQTPGKFGATLLMPEWYLVILFLAFASALGLLWSPLLVALPLLLAALVAPVLQACASATNARFEEAPGPHRPRWQLVGLTAWLHLIQPAARLYGRLRHGLNPFYVRSLGSWILPRRRRFAIWSETWRSPERWLESLESALQRSAPVLRGGNYDAWDLQLRGGFFGSARILMCLEEHGAGRQHAKFRIWPKVYRASTGTLLAGLLAAAALLDGAWLAGSLLAVTTLAFATLGICESGVAAGKALRTLKALEEATRAEAAGDGRIPARPAAAAPGHVERG